MPRFKKRKKWLLTYEVFRMIDLAKSRSKRDYLLLSLMRWSFRVGEIVGHKGLPGIHPEDIRTDTIWVRGKGYAAGIVQDRELPADRTIIGLLREYVADNKIENGHKVFNISERQAENIVKWYAQKAGIEDWQFVSPHRFRAFFATNARDRGIAAPLIQAGMRHKKFQNTEDYIGPASTETMIGTVAQLVAKEKEG